MSTIRSPARSGLPSGSYTAATSGVELMIGASTSKRNACIGITSTPSRAAFAGPATRSASETLPKRRSASASPAVVP